MTQLTYRLDVDDPAIDLRPHLAVPTGGGSELRAYVRLGGCLLWLHNGAGRMYPTNFLKNLIATYDDYAAMKEGGRITEVPPASYTLLWSDFQPSPEQGEERFDDGDPT